MSDQVLNPRAFVERRNPRRRRTDVNPLAAGGLIAAIFAILFMAIPGEGDLHALRVVLVGGCVVTAAILMSFLVLERCGRPTSGHTPRNHPGRRKGDRRQT